MSLIVLQKDWLVNNKSQPDTTGGAPDTAPRVDRDALERLSGTGHFVYDLHTRTLRCSQNLLFLFGLPPLTPPKDLFDLLGPVHPGDMTDLRTALECAVQSHVPFDLTVQVLGADRPARILQLRGDVVPFTEHKALVGHASDVTTAAVSDKDVPSSVKLALMGRIADGIAHEFNDAISAIKCFASFALEGAAGNDTVSSDIREVMVASDRATALTEQLLAAIQNTASSSQLIDVGDLLKNLLPVFDRMGGRDVDVNLHAESGLLPVFTDPSALEQVLVTIASQAVEDVPAGASLDVRAEATLLAPQQAEAFPRLGGPGTYVCIGLRPTPAGQPDPHWDAARGMPQAPGATPAEPADIPPWLTRCQSVLEGARGAVRAMQRGALVEYEVWLPAIARPFDAGQDNAAAEVVPEETSILVVEDEGHVRRAVVRILKRAGYRVVEASDGRAALRILENGDVRPDLLITDVVMPHMSGWELATRVGERFKDMRVLVMTGYGKSVRGQGVETGQARLEKPFTPNVLLTKVTEIFEDNPVIRTH